MAKHFTTSCFIRKNTPEIRKRLEELGYINFSEGSSDKDCPRLITSITMLYHPCFIYVGANEDFKGNPNIIDCSDNEELFFALAALNDKNSYKQWYICNIGNGKQIWHFCERPSMDADSRFFGFISFRKATLTELIEKFNNTKIV